MSVTTLLAWKRHHFWQNRTDITTAVSVHSINHCGMTVIKNFQNALRVQGEAELECGLD